MTTHSPGTDVEALDNALIAQYQVDNSHDTRDATFLPTDGESGMEADLPMGGNSITDTLKVVLNQDAQNNDEAARLGQVKDEISAATDATSWKEPVRLLEDSNIDLNSPPDFIDGYEINQGDRVAFVAQTDATQNGLYEYTSTDTDETALSTVASNIDTGSRVIALVDSSDTLHMIYVSGGDLQHAEGNIGSGFTTTTITTLNNTVNQFGAAVDSNDNIHVIGSETTTDAFYAEYTGSWTQTSAAFTVNNSTWSSRPFMVRADGGEPRVTAFEEDSGGDANLVFRSYDGSTWSSAAVAGPITTVTSQIGGNFVIDSGGDAVIFAKDGANLDIYRGTVSGGFTQEQTDLITDLATLSKFGLDIDGSDNVHALFGRTDGSTYYAVYDGSSLTTDEEVATTTYDDGSLELDSTGDVHIIHGDAGTTDLFYRKRYDDGTAVDWNTNLTLEPSGDYETSSFGQVSMAVNSSDEFKTGHVNGTPDLIAGELSETGSNSVSRTSAANEDSEVKAGLRFVVQDGDQYASSRWQLFGSDPISLGTDNLDFQLTGQSSEINAGDGLVQNGNDFDVVAGDASLNVLTDSINVQIATGGETLLNTWTGDGLGLASQDNGAVLMGQGSGNYMQAKTLDGTNSEIESIDETTGDVTLDPTLLRRGDRKHQQSFQEALDGSTQTFTLQEGVAEGSLRVVRNGQEQEEVDSSPANGQYTTDFTVSPPTITVASGQEPTSDEAFWYNADPTA